MLRRLAPALSLLLLTAACGSPEFDVRPAEAEGPTWFPQIVEFEQNAGLGLSITTDGDGNPHLAYLELPEPVPEGEEAPPPDPLAAVLPAVGHAHLIDDVWTHTEVAQSQADPPRSLGLTAEDQTAIAVDDEGTHHIAWTEGDSVFYSSDPTGETEPMEVESAATAGLAIAVSGTDPGIAFWEEQSDPEGPTALLRFATLQGKDWETETVAEGEPDLSTASVGLGVGADGAPLVAYASAGEVQLATRDAARWSSETVDDGAGGVSMDVDADGNPHLAYLTEDGQVRHAHSIDGGDWETDDVGAAVALATTSIAVDDEGTHHITWQRDVDIAYASNAGGEFAEAALPIATAGGQRARIAAGAGALYLAWYSPTGTRLTMATYSEDEPLIAVPPPTLAPGGADGAACEPEGDTLSITAEGLAFDKDCLAVEAGMPFSIEFNNQDPAPLEHNVAIYTATPPGGEAIFQGEVFAGPSTVTYDVDPIEEPSEDYVFQCDIHPTMAGTFIVAGK